MEKEKKTGFLESLKRFKKTEKDIYCVNCGVRTGSITREWLLDDKCLCAKCQNILPSYYRNKLSTMSSQRFLELAGYMANENKELKKQFKKKNGFLDLELDATNGILRYRTLTTDLYVKLENVEYFSLNCLALTRGSYGPVSLILECSKPNIAIGEDLTLTALDVDCLKFMEHFKAACALHRGPERISHGEGERREQEKPSSPDVMLEKALALFMFDSISEVTAESLKAQRNRLIKSFHPDTTSDEDTKYAQKINQAYELLQKYVK